MGRRRERCVHCQKRPATRPRRLCWRCYYDPRIREQHAMQAGFVRNGVLIALRRGVQQPRHVKPARAPTRALPGSPEKVLVIMGRLARGECLWHPLDPFINRAGELVWPSPRRPALLLAA